MDRLTVDVAPTGRRISYDGALLSALTRIFVKTVLDFYRERGRGKSGAVVALQRTSSDRNRPRMSAFPLVENGRIVRTRDAVAGKHDRNTRPPASRSGALSDDPRVRDQVVHPHSLDAYDNLAERAGKQAGND